MDAPGASFAEVLRVLRDARSLTQEELAERAGLTVKAVGALERGERLRPYPHTVRSLADALALDADERARLVGAVPSRRTAPAGALQVASQQSSAGHVGATTPLFGRDEDANRVVDLLVGGGRRLVTLTGPGGVGKTRLATEAASRLAAGAIFPGGVVVVELAAVRDPAMVLPRLAAALDVPESQAVTTVGTLAPYLSGRRLLVVLDNLEQLLASAPQVADLLAACPDLSLLATSRAPLRIRAEQEVLLAPLPLPSGDALSDVAGSPAVALFLDRAGAAGSPVELTRQSAATLAEICRRLDGLPLALELAASASRLLTPTALLSRLAGHAVGRGLRDLPDRQRTMSATLDWSHDLLEPEEQDLFARLAVFSGSFSLEAVEAVCGETDDVVLVLEALLDQSLVTRQPAVAGESRFRLLEPVRQYAVQRLQLTGKATAVADLHARHVHATTTDLRSALRGPSQRDALDLLEADHANLRAAYLRLLETDLLDEAAELGWDVWLYLALRGHALEGLSWLERLDAVALTPVARCHAATAAAGLLLLTGDLPRMRRNAESAAALAHGVDDVLAAEATFLAATAALFVGDLGPAGPLLDAALARARSGGDEWTAAHALIARAQHSLLAGDLATATERMLVAEAAARVVGNPFTLATALNMRATVTELAGDHRASASLLTESIDLSVTTRIGWTLGYSIPALAAVAVQLDQMETAARLYAASASLSAADAVEETFPASRALSDQGLAHVRAQLGGAPFRQAWEAGRVATHEQVAELARELSRLAPG